ncbi:hypothetical protein DBP19_36105 [Streptomyces sp. CS090A]|uniref:hypothetical protein n=1 Tax=Streptomyces sp. CS090A TaxID=2162710 RepID=UPI000D51A715|nr:hypothetical protein [Streptomyces sp. CS090A]PVC80563.1 hypothetical protein DBP19_36105 [Streptomyces sp. CS090A]
MGHAVMTHAPTQPSLIRTTNLTTTLATQVDDLLNQADDYADNRELTASTLIHAQVIHLIGIRPPASGELARCTCQGCYCDRIYDAAAARTYMDGTVEFAQCPYCADEHPLTGDE